MANRLANEISPYLQQHRDNPVDWYPWGAEALERAAAQNKPILVSIGYSACHWCHVMAHESFENPEIAALLNDRFISIKVDREERPDIDNVYMMAVQAMTGQGGWPLNCFLTPQGLPFFGGTYWPPEDRMGMPGFGRVLQAVADTWETKRDEIINQGEQIRQALSYHPGEQGDGSDIEVDTIEQAVVRLRTQFDPVNGGIGGAPKFPQSPVFEFLLRAHHLLKDDQPLALTLLTLEKMAAGGIHDQIGGGFHRYAVDQIWLVPHFEKMLYDNAQIARLFVDAWRITKRQDFQRVARSTLDYVLREMTAPDGAFYAAQDADSEGEEGKYYVWTPDEVRAVLDPADADLALRVFGITEEGNFEGASVPTRTAGTKSDAADAERIREALYAVRLNRVRPGRDEKVVASWNGMTIRALAEASRAFAEPAYRDAAVRAARFIRSEMDQDGTLHRIYGGGRASVPGYLEDYAHMVDAASALYEATFDMEWIAWATSLTERMLDLFFDKESGVFYDTGRHHDTLILRPRELQDGATPCGTSTAADVLIRMGHLIGDDSCLAIGTAALRSMRELMEDQPVGFGRYLTAACRANATVREVAIAATPGSADIDQFANAVYGRFEPSALIAQIDPADPRAAEVMPWLQDRPMRNGKTTAYLCEQFVCLPPVTVPEDLVMQLEMGTGMSWQAF